MNAKVHGMSSYRRFAAWCFVIAMLTLVVGISSNYFIWNAPLPSSGLGPEFVVLIVIYATLHAVALVVARFIALLASRVGFSKCLPYWYGIITTVGVIASLLVLRPSEYGGIHLFTIVWASLLANAFAFALFERKMKTPSVKSNSG